MPFQFKIQLLNISEPPVWRRLLVPEQFTFLRMHKVIQVAFGWENCHLFQFSPKGYGSEPNISSSFEGDDFAEEKIDPSKIKLSDVFTTPKQRYVYIYDFGDDWKHQIVLEKITGDKMLRAECLAGQGACPPEDCGGPWGYARLLEILESPKDTEHGEMKEWLGLTKKQKWDADAFNLEEINKRVAKV